MKGITFCDCRKLRSKEQVANRNSNSENKNVPFRTSCIEYIGLTLLHQGCHGNLGGSPFFD